MDDALLPCGQLDRHLENGATIYAVCLSLTMRGTCAASADQQSKLLANIAGVTDVNVEPLPDPGTSASSGPVSTVTGYRLEETAGYTAFRTPRPSHCRDTPVRRGGPFRSAARCHVPSHKLIPARNV